MNEENMVIEHKKDNKLLVIILVIIIILLGGYLVYDKVIKDYINNTSNNNNQATTNNDDNTKNEEIINTDSSLDINSNLVQRLYAKVSNNSRAGNTYLDFKEQDISMDNLDYNTKFAMALAISKGSDESYLDCRDYDASSLLPTGTDLDINAQYTCGDGEYNYKTHKFDDSSNLTTIVFLEEGIKNNMKLIFGKDYYLRQTDIQQCSYDFPGGCGNLKYLANIKGYVYIQIPAGGTGFLQPDGINSAKKDGENIIIEENTSYTEEGMGTIKYKYYYTFTYDKDNEDYYLTHIKSVKAN